MGSWNFSYDTLNRLAGASNQPPPGFGGPLPNVAPNYCWSYDAFGNRTWQAGSNQAFTNAVGASACTPATSATSTGTWASYTVNNQISSTNGSGVTFAPTYDPSGDVTGDGQNQYLYGVPVDRSSSTGRDGEGRLCAVYTSVFGATTITGYLYEGVPGHRSSWLGRDADGTRVAKGSLGVFSCDPSVNGFQTTNDYVLGPGGQQIAEMGVGSASSATGANSATGLAWQHANVWAGGKLLATYDKDGLHFYLDDPLGTRRAQTDASGILEQTCVSLPFGDSLSCVSQPESGGTAYFASVVAPTEHHFTGKERDTESGNDYFEARYYSSAMGRFTSPDPYNIVFEMMKGRDRAEQMQILTQYLSNPQSLNKYSYVINNPLTMTDPDGLREANDQDRKAFDQLNTAYVNAAGDAGLQNSIAGAAVALQGAIAAVPDGAKDPAQIGAVEWAIGQIGNGAWGPNGSIGSLGNGMTVPLGPGQFKCNLFTAAAYALGAGVGFGGSGFPLGSWSWRNESFNVPGSNELASGDSLAHLPIASSGSFGSIVAFGVPLHGHSGISAGGGAMIYAGPNGAKIQTERYVQQHEFGQPAAHYREYKP
jgi:RHS repeat-associated protein